MTNHDKPIDPIASIATSYTSSTRPACLCCQAYEKRIEKRTVSAAGGEIKAGWMLSDSYYRDFLLLSTECHFRHLEFLEVKHFGCKVDKRRELIVRPARCIAALTLVVLTDVSSTAAKIKNNKRGWGVLLKSWQMACTWTWALACQRPLEPWIFMHDCLSCLDWIFGNSRPDHKSKNIDAA